MPPSGLFPIEFVYSFRPPRLCESYALSSRAVYRRIGVATTFSPRFLAVLAEAGRIGRAWSAPLCLIHADEFDPEKEARFREALQTLDLDTQSEIQFEPGEPAESILKAQLEKHIDLLVAGALETESVHRNFTGQVARELLRQAPCDLMLYTEPKVEAYVPTSIYVAIPDFSELSQHVFHRAVNLAERRGSRIVTVVHVQTTFAEAKQKVTGGTVSSKSLEESIEDLLGERQTSIIELDYHLLQGNTGFTACEYLQSSGADLLVMPSHMHVSGQPVFAPSLDWIMQVIPTNLFVIRHFTPQPKRTQGNAI
jgi:nucleotide-binding universal stress UspA family protein